MKKTPKTAKLGALERVFRLERGMVDEERRTTFPASSEEPYLRRSWSMGDYLEVLDHSPSSVRLDRLRDGGPLLKNHDTWNQIGVVEGAAIKGRRLEVTARFGNSDEAIAEEKDVADGIRTKVSVGYIVHEMILEKQSDDGPDTYRVTDWEPLEVSTVSIPADPTVGFGRSGAVDAYREHETRVIRRESAKGGSMKKIQVVRREDGVLLRILESDFDEALHERAEEPAKAEPEKKAPVQVVATRGAEGVDRAAIEREERTRVDEILALGSRWNCSDKAREAIREGVSLAAFRDHVWATKVPDGKPVDTPKTHLGMSKKEAGKFSILRAANAIVSGDRSLAPFEMECSREIADRLNRAPQGFFVPEDVQAEEVDLSAAQKRTLSVGTATAGGNLVATNLLAGSFIELFRNAMQVVNAGARFLSGLVGNVDIPRQTGGATAGWVAEAGNVSASDMAVDKVSLVPRTLGVRTDITRKLLLQATPAIEGLVRSDIAMALGLGLDSASLNGSGTAPVPRGIRNVAGVGLVALGTNGAAPDWDSQVKLVQALQVANANIGSQAFLMTGAAWSKLMRTGRAAGYPDFILESPGESLLGRRVLITEQLPSNLVKGSSGAVCSAEILGNWTELLIGEWGVLDIFPDPYTLGDSNGLVLRCFKDADVAVRHAASFAMIVDMLTT